MRLLRADVAQPVEQRFRKPQVVSSSLTVGYFLPPPLRRDLALPAVVMTGEHFL